MTRFLKGALLSVAFVSTVLFASSVQAADPALGDFKCPTFTVTGEKLMIFKFSPDDDYNAISGQPAGGRFFCVKVKDTDPHATWAQMLTGVDKDGVRVIDREWGDEDVRMQINDSSACYSTGIPGVSGWHVIGTAGDAWNSYQSDDEWSDKTNYLFINSVQCGSENQVKARLRYYFNDLDAALDDAYVYFFKQAAADEQQVNPIPVCAAFDGRDKSICEADSKCLWQAANAKCLAKADPGIKCSELPAPDPCSAANYCTTGENNTCVKKTLELEINKAVDQYIADRYSMPKGYDGPLPECAFTGSCRNVEDLLQLGVNVADWLFKIIAGLGFAFFVYGGLTMVLSFGNSEKVGQGKQILVAATVGIIIAFSAYVLVSFIVKAIGINPALSPF